MALEAVQDFRLSRTIFTPPSLRIIPTVPAAAESALIDRWRQLGTLSVRPGNRHCLRPQNPASGSRSGEEPDSDIDLSQGFGVLRPVQGLEIVKPPYGRVTAIDMNSGDHLWWIANADTPERIKNHPLLEGIDVPGQVSRPDLACYSPKHCCLSAKARAEPGPALFSRSRQNHG